MMICFNLLYQSAGAFRSRENPPETVLSQARGQGMGTVTMRTLTSDIFQRWIREVAPEVAGQLDWSAAMLGFNLSHPQVDVAVVGMRSENEVDRNADVVDQGLYRVDLATLHTEFPTRPAPTIATSRQTWCSRSRRCWVLGDRCWGLNASPPFPQHNYRP